MGFRHFARDKEALMDDNLPPANEKWDDNRYFYERLYLEREMGEI